MASNDDYASNNWNKCVKEMGVTDSNKSSYWFLATDTMHTTHVLGMYIQPAGLGFFSNSFGA